MCSMFMDFNRKQTQNFKQLQHLMVTPQMQQAIQLMQMPIMELSNRIETELAENPILEYDEPECSETLEEEMPLNEKELNFENQDLTILKQLDDDFRDHILESESYYTKRSSEEEELKSYQEQSIPFRESLFEHLIKQAKELFSSDKDFTIAEILIGYFDDHGFLTTPLSEIASLNHFEEKEAEKVLAEIQSFEPFGVGARTLQESFLIQMRFQGKKNGLAYQIIDQCFYDLVHNRVFKIIDQLKCSAKEAQHAIKTEIAKLNMHPGNSYSREVSCPIIPDASILFEEDACKIVIHDDWLPTIRLNSKYFNMLENPDLPKDTREFILNKLLSAKWFLKNIDQRNETLFRVTDEIAKEQKEFFRGPKGILRPLTMKTIAENLGLHESTIARAVANKYVATPKGLFELKYFFSNRYTNSEGEALSSKTVRNLLKAMIDRENKKHPLSDESLSKLLEEKGIPCARRTIAKYRAEMKIGNAQQRRQF